MTDNKDYSYRYNYNNYKKAIQQPKWGEYAMKKEKIFTEPAPLRDERDKEMYEKLGRFLGISRKYSKKGIIITKNLST